VQSTNTAGTGVASVVTPVLQLVPRILRNDVRIRLNTNTSVRRAEVESLPSGSGECGTFNGFVGQCGNGGRTFTFDAPEAGRYVFRVRASADQAGPDHTRLRFNLDGRNIGERPVYSTSRSDANIVEVVADVPAGRHTFQSYYFNEWCGGCGGSPDGLNRGDRNAWMDWYEVAGPYAKSGSRGSIHWSMQPNTDVSVNTEVAAPTSGNALTADNAGTVTVRGTGTRVINHAGITAGRAYFTRITATNLAGSATTGWIERRFPAINSERVTNIDKPNRRVTVAFSVGPDAHGSVQYRAAGSRRFTGCEGGNWQTLSTGASRGSHTATIANLNDNTYYCWRAVAEHARGMVWRTIVIGAPQVFVFDRTAPRITPPSYRVFEQETNSGSTITVVQLGTPRVDDIIEGISINARPFYCPRQVAQTCVPWSESASRQKGTHYVRWRSEDGSGNTGYSGFQRFAVRDTTRPAYTAGPQMVVEAASVAGTIVNLKTLTTGNPTTRTFRGTDACDSRLDVSQQTLVNGLWVNAATHRFPRSTNPQGAGDHTVRVRLRDDSGNMTTGTYSVRVQDTTAPTFARVPRAIVGLRDGCVTAYLPRPTISDNSYPANTLTLTKDVTDGPRDQGGKCWEQGGVMEGEIRVHTVTWTATDPAGNRRSAQMRVEVRRPTLRAVATVTSGGAEVEMGTYVRDDVRVQVTLQTRTPGCNQQPRSGELDWIPTPTRIISEPQASRFTGVFAEDGNYIGGVALVWHCDEFALIADLAFGIDTVPPRHDYSELINDSVNPADVDTFLRQFVGNRLDVGGVTFTDDRSGIQTIRVTLNPGDPGRPWGGEYALESHTVRGRGVLITGAPRVANLRCIDTDGVCVESNERPLIDMAALRAADDGHAYQHKLRFEVRDFAGNATITDRYFLLRDYRSAIVDVQARARTMLQGAGGEDYEGDLTATVNHLGQAVAYWDARTREEAGPEFRRMDIAWSPSFSRAANAANALVNGVRNDGPRVLDTFSKDIGSAMLGEMRMYTDQIEALRADSELALSWWTGNIARARTLLAAGYASNYGTVQAARSRDAYNELSALYELTFDTYSRVQENRSVADASDDPHEDRSLIGLTVSLQRTLHYILREQLIAAEAVSNVGADQLQRSITKLGRVNQCTNRLILQGLNDREFTHCYLEIVEVVHFLRQIQGALVDTTTWRTILAHSVYAMLDISLHYSLNALVTIEGHESDPLALRGIAEWRAGMAQLQSNQVDAALDRYIANRCRIVQLYNRYWYDEEDPDMGRIDPAPYCN